MLHINTAMTVPYDEELGFADELAKPTRQMKTRGRASSDDLSTAAPSPEASPAFGPQKTTPLMGPEDLSDSDGFLLPDAQDSDDCTSLQGSSADFELAGFDDEDGCTGFVLQGLDDDSTCHGDVSEEDASDAEEDIASELLALLSDLSSLRAEARESLEMPSSGIQKIPYPELESGFLPTQFMSVPQSWLLPAGRAETGKWAAAMAPRPGNHDSMEPLNVVLGPAGVTLEIASAIPEECWGESERNRRNQAKAIFRRRRGRSRSPFVSMDDMMPTGVLEGSPRGRPRLMTC